MIEIKRAILSVSEKKGIVELAKFLSENHFLVGISLDGPKEIHNTNRIDNQGQGTFKRVIEIKDYRNRKAIFEYDALGNLISKQDFYGRKFLYKYDE